jgi:hypothetical protein
MEPQKQLEMSYIYKLVLFTKWSQNWIKIIYKWVFMKMVLKSQRPKA